MQNDSNKFYTYNDFVTNLTDQVSLVASICPGITQLMDARVNYLTNYSGYQGEPVISNISYHPQNLNLGDDIWITAEILDADYAMISFRFGKNQRFRILEMFDDGNHNDGASGDGVYGIKIPKCSNSIDYYIYAENTSSGVFSPERAAYHFYNIKVKIDKGDLVINELMSNNKNIVKDQSGKYEDWIELYNTTAYPISTYGLYLTDTLSNLLKWDLPNYVVAPDSYLTIWADEDGGQGDRHANFKLSNLGEHLILSNSDSSIIDSVVYPSQIEDISYGRSPNGIGLFTMLTPTFNANNDVSFINNYTDHFITAYPNPFNNTLFIDAKDSYVVADIYGREVFNGFSSKINTSEWNTGIYFIYLNYKTVIKVLKI